MRYIDTGARNPEHALGSWLEKNALNDSTVRELRWQTAFFDANCLGYFAPLMARLNTFLGVLRVLVGSNDGMTQRADVEALLAAAGAPRKNRQIGIVCFSNGYFHPKTVHIVRSDRSAAAYVGSANLTQNGVTSLNVEAGLLVDEHEGDDASVLDAIADAIDWWFAQPRPGVNLVSNSADVQKLVNEHVLDAPRPPRPKPGLHLVLTGARLSPLVETPPLSTPVVPVPPTPSPAAVRPEAAVPTSPPSPRAAVEPARWWKELSRSDAQRKLTGKQRGSITLVQAGHFIDAQTYFRRKFFEAATWVPERTNTGERRESAVIPFEVNILGQDLGVLRIKITYASNRESAQANYTSLLHIGPLAGQFASRNLTGTWLELSRRADGGFTLSITTNAP
jgi:hypothetical protein